MAHTEFPKRVYIDKVGYTVNSTEEEQQLLSTNAPITEQASDDGSQAGMETKKAKKGKK
jgi:hypothetical protein